MYGLSIVWVFFCVVTIALATNQPPLLTCTRDEIDEFFANQLQLENCERSVRSILGLLTTDSTSELQLENFDAALNVFCTEECGERVAHWYFTQCNDLFFTSRMYYLCLDTSNTATGSHCLYALWPLYDITANIDSCLKSEGSCPSGCLEALHGIIDQIGCCFNSIYNETDSLSFLVESGILNQSTAIRLQNLGNACSVVAPVACAVEGISFPGDVIQTDGERFDILVCSEVDANSLLPNELPESCQDSLFTIVNSTAVSPNLDPALDVFCTQECGGKIATSIHTQCNDAYFSNGLYYFCLGTNNTATVGSRCRYALPPQYNLTNYITLCVSAVTEVTSCPEGCATVLEMISMDIGCCYNSIYNNTAYFPVLTEDETYHDEPTEMQFQTVGNPKFWSSCGVSIPPGPCTNEGFGFLVGGAEVVLSSTVLIVSLISFLLHFQV